MNIYTNSASALLGYVPFLPSDGGGAFVGGNDDRVVILWDAFGRDAPAGAPYDQGRTATHEVGHYLGLYHPFDGGCGTNSCNSTGDTICDLDDLSSPQLGCSASPASCGVAGGGNPLRNYMNYTDDTCMTHFTQEQIRRMRCSMQHYRPNLDAGPAAEGEGEVPCAYEDVFDGELDAYLIALNSIDPSIPGDLAAQGQVSGDTLDLENFGLFYVLADPLGDGLPDSIQLAMIETALCTGKPNIADDYDTNLALLDADIATLTLVDGHFAILAPLTETLAAMIGSSQLYLDGINDFIEVYSEGAETELPSNGSYIIFTSGAKAANELFSASGDIDGDGVSNVDEYDAVIAAGGSDEDALIAILNDTPFWFGNPALPVGAPLALGALAAAMTLIGSRVLRRKK